MPRQPQPRREIVFVGGGAGARIATLSADEEDRTIESRAARLKDRLGRGDGAEIDAHGLLPHVVHGRRDFVAQTQVEGQPARDFPIVLHIERGERLAAIHAPRSEIAADILRESQEETRQQGAGSIAGRGSRGLAGGEFELAERIGSGQRHILDIQELAAGFDDVLAALPGHVVVKLESIVAGLRPPSAHPAHVGETGDCEQRKIAALPAHVEYRLRHAAEDAAAIVAGAKLVELRFRA